MKKSKTLEKVKYCTRCHSELPSDHKRRMCSFCRQEIAKKTGKVIISVVLVVPIVIKGAAIIIRKIKRL